MDAELAASIHQARSGHAEAYDLIVRRFQDMAVGYGYARLGDLQLAEDAAQEAFLTAYIALPSLREPAAFPGWFRRILIKHIDRIHRRRRAHLPLDGLAVLADGQPALPDVVEQQEVQQAVLTALQRLPVAQRDVVTLFYMGAYSHADISAFLAIPVSTVKMRLYHARTRLARHLLAQLEEHLPSQRPSRNRRFKESVMSYPVHTKAVPAQPIITLTRDCLASAAAAATDAAKRGARSSADCVREYRCTCSSVDKVETARHSAEARRSEQAFPDGDASTGRLTIRFAWWSGATKPKPSPSRSSCLRLARFAARDADKPA